MEGAPWEERERIRGRLPHPLGPGILLIFQASRLPSRLHPPPPATLALGAEKGGRGEFRIGRQEGSYGRSGRGGEGDCSTHSSPQYIRQMLTTMKGEIDTNTITVGDFNTPLSPMDRSTKTKINKETQALNDT